MNLYGYPKEQGSSQGLLRMKEVTSACTPAEARDIAKFMNEAATRMEQRGEAFGHMHIDEVVKPWKRSWPQVIVTPPDAQ
jgi:hypothetical protein